MSKRTCNKCGNSWSGRDSPFCPACMTYTWENTSGFIKPKHNPFYLPLPLPKKRSVVTADFIIDKRLYISAIAYDGHYYYDTRYKNFTCVLNQPLGTTAGSAIPPHYPYPTCPLDSQIVVDAFNHPHVYAENMAVIQFHVKIGRLIPSVMCNVKGCSNLAVPGTTVCSFH